uniref:Uncharacterized protein n=1 Tax=Panagrolaimus superbus TaxID=310955 RepID=A0A914YM82_9BILA
MSTTRNMIFIVHDIVNMSEYNIQTSKWKNFEFNRDIENYDPTQIFAQIQSATNLKKIKAMVFTIMDLCFPTIAHAYEFRLKCSEFCKSNGILYFYIPVSSIIAFSVMSKAKVMNALVIREESHFASIHNVIVEKVMHVLGDKITPYDVTIQCLSKIAVLMDEVLLINVEYIKALPF